MTRVMRLINFLKSKTNFRINNTDWVTEKFIEFESQSIHKDLKPYGWTLEVNWKYSNGWEMYWNRKIYKSSKSAAEAALQCSIAYRPEFKWRIRPLYIMDQAEYRNFQIEKIIYNK